MGEVGDIAFTDVVAVAVGLAEVDGLVGLAVGGGPGGAGDVHVHIIRHNRIKNKQNIHHMHVYALRAKIAVNPMTLQGLCQNIRGEHPIKVADSPIPKQIAEI